LIVASDARRDDRVLEIIVLIARALALACRGHQELVLENIALRQQLRAALFFAFSSPIGPQFNIPFQAGDRRPAGCHHRQASSEVTTGQ
jgi:hypothetical protein